LRLSVQLNNFLCCFPDQAEAMRMNHLTLKKLPFRAGSDESHLGRQVILR
jgi:hypothetical protein